MTRDADADADDARTATLGTLTIGQAPRPDITPILAQHLPAATRCLHAGLLDGLTRADIERLYAPEPGQATLITRLLDGGAVVVGKPKALDLMNRKLAELQGRGCDVILLLCTGAFEGLVCDDAWLIEPDLVVSPSVAAIAGHRQVGIVVPLQAQIASEARKWRALQRAPICAVASPYSDDFVALAQSARDLKNRGAELLVMDCMGFVEAHRDVAARASGLPVILSNSLIARLTAELLS
ncbi:MAG: AroM family protein [Janthinobacterium lividum]